MKYSLVYSFLLAMMVSSCIGDDFIDDEVEPVIRITNPIDSIAVDSSYQFEYSYLNNVGVAEDVEVNWTSLDEDIIQINSNGLATAINPGSTVVQLEYSNGTLLIQDENQIGVGMRTVTTNTGRSGIVSTTSSYVLKGEFTLTQLPDNEIALAFGEDYEASTALPGLFVYLSNNPNTTANAHEIQAVEVFKGAHTYIIKDVALNEYSYVLYFCKPFNVKVGDGKIE